MVDDPVSPAGGQTRKRAAGQDPPDSTVRKRAKSIVENPVANSEIHQLTTKLEGMGQPPSPPPQVSDEEKAKLDKAKVAAAIFLPALPFDKDEEIIRDRDELLRTVITNLEAHNAKVRAKLTALYSNQSQPVTMDMTKDQLPPQKTYEQEEADSAAIRALLATPYKEGDPPPVAPKVTATSTDTPKILDAYNRNAEEGINVYRHALERRGSLAGSGDGESRRSSAADVARGVSPLSRRGSAVTMRGARVDVAATGADVVMGGTDSYDRSRDPRLARR